MEGDPEVADEVVPEGEEEEEEDVEEEEEVSKSHAMQRRAKNSTNSKFVSRFDVSLVDRLFV